MSSIDDFFDKKTKIYLVYLILNDCQWHCRECEYPHVQTTQIAGGSGIQGLQRGTKTRLGMDIESGNHFCTICDRTTRHDRWRGHLHDQIPAPSMPRPFAKRAVDLLGSRDVVENTERPANQLTIDHKIPMIRWNAEIAEKQGAFSEMGEDEIRANFQLLKASNGSVSHNMPKSRSCEQCYKTGHRGTPFGIAFFYKGGPRWAPKDKKDASGCVGCGWHDFLKWRQELNRRLKT